MDLAGDIPEMDLGGLLPEMDPVEVPTEGPTITTDLPVEADGIIIAVDLRGDHPPPHHRINPLDHQIPPPPITTAAEVVIIVVPCPYRIVLATTTAPPKTRRESATPAPP